MTIRDDSELAVEVRVSSEHRRQTRMSAVAAPHRHSRGFPTPALGQRQSRPVHSPVLGRLRPRHTLLADIRCSPCYSYNRSLVLVHASSQCARSLSRLRCFAVPPALVPSILVYAGFHSK